jgi:uncharacterized integral membrane protein
MRAVVGTVIGGTTVATVLAPFGWTATLAIVVMTALFVGSLCWVLASKARTRRLTKIIRAVRRP